MAIFTGVIWLDLIGIIIILLFTVFYAKCHWDYQTWKRKGVPYLEPRFPFGNVHPLNRGVSMPEDMFNVVERAKKQGWKYFGMFIATKPVFIPLDIEIIKHILTKDFNHFTDRFPHSMSIKDNPLRSNLFVIGGTKWRHLRTKLTPTFTSGKLKSMFQTLVDCGSFLEKALEEHNTEEPIDIKNMLACFTTDIIGSCAFGLECNSFKDPDSQFLKYGRKLLAQSGSNKLMGIFIATFPYVAKVLRLKVVDDDVGEFYYRIVTEAVKYREENKYTRNDFLQLLINLKNNIDQPNVNKDDGATLTMNELVAQCFIFFIAGYETSSTTVTFALYELSINPEIQEKLRKEIFTVLEKYDNKICYDSLKEMEYLQQVIDESLRKYPSVPFLIRRCVEDYRIPDTDVILEKGTDVRIPVKNIHYDEKYYENPKEFDPDRFSPENKSKRHPYTHLPFGEGPRNCIGMRFGLMQAKIGLVVILRNFRLTLSTKTKTPLEFDPSLNFPSTKGRMWLNLEKL